MTGEHVGHGYSAVAPVLAVAVESVLEDATDLVALSVIPVRRGWKAAVRDGRDYVGTVDRKVRPCQHAARQRPCLVPSFASWSFGDE